MIKIPEHSKNIIQILHQDFAAELKQINDIILTQLTCTEDLIEDIGKYLLDHGGKRIRPLLTILSGKLFSQETDDNNIKLAAATEFIHAATLLHDDVVDSSLLRRFKPTVNSVWGNQASILVGDYIFSQSFKLMVSTNSIDALRCLADASSIIAIGEVAQLSSIKTKNFPSISIYFKIIESKTSELFAAACKVGGIISNASQKDIDALYNFGKNIGIIFQIRDDMLDYFSESNKIGKNIGDDFYENKITLPIILLREQANEEELKILNSYFFSDLEKTENDFEVMIDLLNKYNISSKIDELVVFYSKKALHSLDIIKSRNSSVLNYLKKIIAFAANRES